MSTASTSGSSRAASTGGYARKMSIKPKPKPSISIHIDNHYKSKIYTTSSAVSGHVTINPPNDVRFDTLQILLLGTSRTRIDAVNIPQATAHTLLKLTMPIPESTYPIPRIFEAGRTYRVPFNFVIPNHLTINACNHNVPNNSLQEHHVRLPPTVGSWEKDDFSPNMSRVQYHITARVLRDEEVGGPSNKIIETSQEIRVLPAVPEDPPLNITPQDKLYTMSKSKTLRKTILSSKVGKVTVSAGQPGAAMISADGSSISPTTAQLDLEFEPASSDSQPPKVTGVSSKVTAVTYFSAGGINHYPNLKDTTRSFGGEGRGCYSHTTSLASTPLAGKVAWKQKLTAQARRDSGYCSDARSDSEDNCTTAGGSGSSDRRKSSNSNKKSAKAPPPYYHTARLQVPIVLPTHKKTFLPTFHSCITSRVYVLNLAVSLSAGGGGGSTATTTTTTLTLAVPLQLGVAPLPDDRADETGLPTFEAAMEDARADAYLRPRVLGVPDVEFARTGLPGYGEVAGTRAVVEQ